MSYRGMTIASAATIAVLAGIAAIALSRLQAGVQLPTHWNAAGEADRFADADTALFLPVALTIVISLTMVALPQMEPLQDRLSGSAPLLKATWGGLLAMMALIEVMVAAPAFGFALPATTSLVGIGLLFAVIGNALPKSRPGFFVGIRTPWTIADPANWIATHRLGARTMVAGGAILVAGALLPIAPQARAVLTVSAIGLAIVPPVAYSWWYWRAHRPA
ncbi:SdpI family protein [uncultured Sphingomonas sp.]|uniref:SdpI family protein n=1 Tax=uncultured Sphingomonas sp. TaxID=158754 RepID=UPI0035CA986A